MSSTPVHIVATESEPSWKFYLGVVRIIFFIVTIWLVMLLLPVAFGPEWAWGFWRVAAAVYVIRLVLPPSRQPFPIPAQFVKNRTY